MLRKLGLALALAAAIGLPASLTLDAMNAPAHACGARGICQQH